MERLAGCYDITRCYTAKILGDFDATVHENINKLPKFRYIDVSNICPSDDPLKNKGYKENQKELAKVTLQAIKHLEKIIKYMKKNKNSFDTYTGKRKYNRTYEQCITDAKCHLRHFKWHYDEVMLGDTPI